jgi:hypothetical protein
MRTTWHLILIYFGWPNHGLTPTGLRNAPSMGGWVGGFIIKFPVWVADIIMAAIRWSSVPKCRFGLWSKSTKSVVEKA